MHPRESSTELALFKRASYAKVMDILRDYHFMPEASKGASVAIGNFDGVHLGHQHILAVAAQHSAPLGVLTFEPHPREFFAPQAAPFRLMSAGAKASRLAKLGVERLYELNFNEAMSHLTPEEFCEGVLHKGLGVRNVVVGADFCFGKGRAGTADELRAAGKRLGFDVTIAEILHDNEISVSSTNIRNALAEGRPRDAARMLGHWHRIEGPVLHGEKRGRELGYPTANMDISGLHLPLFGVYAVLVDVLTGPNMGSYHGVASMGVRPMFEGEVPNLETFLFDFKGDLYGQELSIGLVDHLRPEENFDSLEGLITQMDADSLKARNILGAL